MIILTAVLALVALNLNALFIAPATTVSAENTACEYWVAPEPTGSDNNSGSIDSPWATLKYAAENVPDNHCTVWFKGGEYYGSHRLNRQYTTLTTFRADRPYHAVLHYDGVVLILSGATNVVIEGFRFHHTGPDSQSLLVTINSSAESWAEMITLRNNIFHDSYNNDLLKIHNGSRFITVENNLFYNQGASEQHMDVNSVTDVTIQDNIFFNDFAGSGRSDPGNTKAFITIKDSNEGDDGLLGSERVTVRRNVFLNWQGGKEPFIQVGNDGKPYHEAQDVWIENNLMIGNSPDEVNALLAVSGARNVTFANNTVTGDLPSGAYAFRIDQKGLNPQNQDIYFYNNIWSDPTGTMGAGPSGGSNKFSNGALETVNNLVIDNNLYWNGDQPIPPGETVSPLVDDARNVVVDPLLNTDLEDILLPRWDGALFLSGNTTIRQEFIRLVESYGKIPAESPAINLADPAYAPADDILGYPRSATPDPGAYEHNHLILTGCGKSTTIWLDWSDPQEPDAASLSISYSNETATSLISNIPPTARSYVLQDIRPFSLYTIILTVHDNEGATLAQSNTLELYSSTCRFYLPLMIRSRSYHESRMGWPLWPR
jgi:hypothetical protein